MSGALVASDGLNPVAVRGVEIGTLLALLVHGSLVTQFITYYQRYPSDSVWLKLVIAAIGLASLGHVIFIIWTLCLITMRGIDELSLPFAMPITFPVGLIFTSILQFLVQLTYAYRMYKFSKNYVIAIFVALGVIYNIIAAPAFALEFPLDSFEAQLAYQHKKFWLINSQFINTAVNDVVITLCMCYYLRKGRTDVLKRTSRVIERLMVWTIQTSAPTCFLGIAVVATFMLDMPNNVWIGLSVLATPIYPAALLAFLNGRESLTRDTKVQLSTDTTSYSTAHSMSRSIPKNQWDEPSEA
ncbi:hypothetical protein BDN72DRAFT_966080 [Pluteus cervinus]|uniref:Uncharacterized protein n=1 Tax=Pluteus cervinus TaxID=181527 RepID=A0ACD3A145_9AGAR|nr:hypothetical protein BDN72DRAFT_966080 [Pluteus cervinus]